MPKRSGTVARLTSPVRALVQRFGFLLLVAATFGTLALGKADTVLVERARVMVVDGVAPVIALLSEPVQGVEQAMSELRELAEVRQINESLRDENERLMAWHHKARQLEAENARLRQLLNLPPDPGARYVSARVIGDNSGAFARSVLVAAGGEDGTAEGHVALSGEGLAGRVVEVGERAARVMLITDISSRIPVSVGLAGERAVMAGDNSAQPRLLYLPPGHQVEAGDRVVTSGHGGVFPPDVPVGVVAEVGEQAIRLRPYVDWTRLDYLRLVDYELPGLIAPLTDDQVTQGRAATDE